ncbi:MAG: NAD(P) transhydrogenase subunit alpha [Bacillota bacterium]|jgi:NAD(P) transhydrogenase subunit alpha|nr:NAD(P) transhydrogenase subunit alpha [Bacillota bacterium]HOA78603.1 NAD(P) transhydrogenase subunit alpha [Bacilli bacterium]HPZ27281.1 NAD(P) transhydrogenase subunit alpha [Bacilli bacterium]HQC89542.1 NAD(P) transhydrogenase subunit alpha [Bacilli bacterium]
MDTIQIVLLVVFVVAAIVGYLIINRIPSLLHTPLMSGTNALSGITILGALVATAVAVKSSSPVGGYIFGSLAIVLAMINVAGGFIVTDRMLRMFDGKDKENESND